MKISDVRIKPLSDSGKLMAIASITIDSCFVVHDLKLIKSENGFFVVMPSKKMNDGQYKDVAHPLDTETRLYIQNCVIEAYMQTCANQANTPEEEK